MNGLSNSSIPFLLQEVEYIHTWEFEKNIDTRSWQLWFEKHVVSFTYLAIIYIVSAFLGQHLMRDQKPFKLRNSLAAWNFMFGAFSIVGFLRTAPELFYILSQKDGFHLSVCSNDQESYPKLFWGLLMVLSKVAEFGDTAFIVLKKRPLTFLNWGHHALALFGSVTAYGSGSSFARWFLVMNFFVHAFMYTYFGLKTLNYNIPKRVSIYITAIQVTQMIIGTIVAGYSLILMMSGSPCQIPFWQTWFSFLCYGILTYLFGNFFVKNYLPKARSVKKVD